MKLPITYALWTSYLASKLPCPLSSYTFSKEHVLPSSLFPKTVSNRSVIPLPRAINNARGRRPYTNVWSDGYAVYSCGSCPHPGWCQGAALVTPNGVVPPDVFKGPIARSVLRSIKEAPGLSQKIVEQVLDYDTAIEWDRRYTMSTAEKAWLDDIEL